MLAISDGESVYVVGVIPINANDRDVSLAYGYPIFNIAPFNGHGNDPQITKYILREDLFLVPVSVLREAQYQHRRDPSNEAGQGNASVLADSVPQHK
jgi:hypothetical protein